MIRKIGFILLFFVALTPAFAQQKDEGVIVDYNAPKTYIVGGVSVEGNNYFSPEQIIQITGLQRGLEVVVPGEEISSIVDRLWQQKFFEDVTLSIDHLGETPDTAYFKISIIERPRVSRWTFSGIKQGEQKDLQERLNLRRGGEFSEYVQKTATDIIKKFYREKGFQLAEVEVQVKKDTLINSAIRVNFHITKGSRVKIKRITFDGNEHIKDSKLARSMKKTKDMRLVNFFNSKKFDEKEYENDKKSLISTFNEAGYRDARILSDSIYYMEPNRLAIDFKISEGKQYFFRNITWTGNSVYSTDVLNDILQIHPGDVYDVVTMEARLFGGGKQQEFDVSRLYRDNGYLFFNLSPVELNIVGDSVDVEMRIAEGKQATLDNIVINGNNLTNERVVRRQLFTRPGYLFSQTDFERSIREISAMGQFDPEAITDAATGYSIIPNSINNTVDIVYNVTEKPSSQLEISGGWGGNTFVATVGVSFNNFSTRRMFDKGAWRPVPLGDAQNFSIRFQTNGTYYTCVSASFMEPWVTGKKPTSLGVSLYYERETDSYVALGMLSNERFMEVYGAVVSYGKRLKWPDNYFQLVHTLSWKTYRLHNWYSGYFLFDEGVSHNLSYTINLVRSSIDQNIYPRQGSEFSLAVQLTPPYSLFRRRSVDDDGNSVKVKSWRDVQYDNMDAQQRYRWIEYHKWTFSATVYTKLVADLVLMASAHFGYLGYYNRNWGYSPFEGFLVGGDGMSGYTTYGQDVIALRGYENYSLTPYVSTPYGSGTAYGGNVYDKFTVELRYPVVMQPSSTIYALVFLEGGNCWSDIRNFNPFQIKRSAGVGVRLYLPVVGMLGVDWGWGFDDDTYGKSQFHFVIGQQF